jgi:hypothetical protein
MKRLLFLTAILSLTGCKTSKVLGPALLQSAVASVSTAALFKHPEAVADVRAAADVICASVNNTNVSPDQIVADLNANGPLKRTTWLIVNSAITTFSLVYASLANTNQAGPYGLALCAGLQSAANATSPSTLHLSGKLSLSKNSQFPTTQ